MGEEGRKEMHCIFVLAWKETGDDYQTDENKQWHDWHKQFSSCEDGLYVAMLSFVDLKKKK